MSKTIHMSEAAYFTLTPQEVIAAFTRFTGISFRFVPHSVQRQANDFVKRGFTLADMELVILWVRRQIANRRSGFSDSCYQWRRLFGEHGAADEFLVFQERLGLAEVEMRSRGWRPKLTTLAPEPKPVAKAAPAEPPESKPEPFANREQASTHLKDWLASQRRNFSPEQPNP